MIGYSVGNFGKTLLLSGIDLTLLFVLTDLLGIAPAAVSALMLVIFLGDLIFDISAGYLANLGRTRGIGYRRMIALGAVPCCATFALVYSLPALGLKGFGILAATLLAFRATYAIIDVPHNSLLAKVAQASHSRGRASGYRFIFSALANMAIAVVLTPSIVQAARLSRTAHLSALGIGSAALCCLTLWMAAWSSDYGGEPRWQSTPKSRIALFPKWDGLLAGMIVISIVTGFAIPMFERMVIYLTKYVFNRPDFASHILLAVTMGQFVGAAIWTFLLNFYEKTKLLAASYAVASIAVIAFAAAGNRLDALFYIAIGIGIGHAGVFMLPWAILANIVDFAEFRHHERRETAMFAIVLVTLKSGAAASTGIIALVLGHLGYAPGTRQAPQVLCGMKVLAFAVPVIGSVASIWVLQHLSVGHARHARVLRTLRARRASQAVPCVTNSARDKTGD